MEVGWRGVPVVLVHGFPDTSDVWGTVARAVEGAVSGGSVRRSGVSGVRRLLVGEEGYRVERLVEDLAVVVEVVGGPVHLVGHDWGSLQGWAAVAARPELFLSFTSVSGPDLGHVGDGVRRNRSRPVKVLGVVWRSWYVAGFKVPLVPELVWRVPVIRQWMRAGRRSWSTGWSCTGPTWGGGGGPGEGTVRVHQIKFRRPVCVREHLEAAEPWVEELSRSRIHAGHWAPRTHPEQVVRHIEDAIDGERRSCCGRPGEVQKGWSVVPVMVEARVVHTTPGPRIGTVVAPLTLELHSCACDYMFRSWVTDTATV